MRIRPRTRAQPIATYKAPVTRHEVGTRHRHLVARGHCGLVQFNLQRVTGGIYVEREDIPARGPHVTQSVTFTAVCDFERWCNEDPIRFEYPLLHARLRREGCELWLVAVEP